MRVLAIADSDSYVKWGAAVLRRAPSHWETSLLVVATPAAPSAGQLQVALDGAAARVVRLDALTDEIARTQPDVVLLAVRGPVVRVLIRAITGRGSRPVLVTGLPGISIPVTRKALYYRSQADLVLLHSHREVREFALLARQMGLAQEFALASLPFLPGARETAGGASIVFAAQAKVPRSLEDRERLIDLLADAARANPSYRVVVKLRGVAGEAQTHAEKYPLDTLLAARDDVPPNLVVSTGSMAAHLRTAEALVTVSSTAAIEAIAMGVPVLALDDFGVDDALINTVFLGSGLLGSASSLARREFRHPDAGWLDDNYFHDPADETWVAAIEGLATRAAVGELPLRRAHRGTLGGNLRRVWDRKRALGRHDRSVAGYLALGVGLPLRRVVLLARRVRRAVRGPDAPGLTPIAAERATAR